MIRKRLARNLPPSDAATVGENSEEQRIHTSALLQIVQDLFGTFVDERNGSHLNADHCFGLAGKCHGRHCQYSASPRAKPEEFTPFDIGFPHGWILSNARVDSVRLHRLMKWRMAKMGFKTVIKLLKALFDSDGHCSTRRHIFRKAVGARWVGVAGHPATIALNP